MKPTTPRAAGTPRVKLRRTPTNSSLPVYRAFYDGAEVARVDGINAAPSNPTRPTAWRIVVPGRPTTIEDRIVSARLWIERNGDDLVELAARRAAAAHEEIRRRAGARP
jgi:hypothetical protein